MGFPSATLFYGFPFHCDNPSMASVEMPSWPPAVEDIGEAHDADVGGDCEVVIYGQEFCMCFAVAVTASKREVSNWNLGDSAIELPRLEPAWREQLREASERAGIPWQEPGWHLVINDT